MAQKVVVSSALDCDFTTRELWSGARQSFDWVSRILDAVRDEDKQDNVLNVQVKHRAFGSFDGPKVLI